MSNYFKNPGNNHASLELPTMTITLTRQKLFFNGVSILLVYLFISRVNFIMGSEVTTGVVTGKSSSATVTRGIHTVTIVTPRVTFYAGSEKYVFYGEQDMPVMINQEVPVIYKKSNPAKARVYSLTGFWLPPLIWGIIPLMLFSAAIFSFMDPADNLIFKFGKEKLPGTGSIVQYKGGDKA